MARAGLVDDGLITRIWLALAKARRPEAAPLDQGPMTIWTPAAARLSKATKPPQATCPYPQ